MLWQFGLGKPRLGGLLVAATEERRIAVVTVKGTAKKVVATLIQRSRTAPKVAGARGGME